MMFKVSRAAGLALVLFLLACAGPASAQTAADPETEKAELLRRLMDGGGPAERRPTTYETAKEYLRKFGEPEDDIVRYIKAWVAKYEAAVREFEAGRVVAALDAAPAAQSGGSFDLRREEEKARLYSQSGPRRVARTPQERRAAYELGREFLRKHGEPEDDLVRYIRDWVLKYEAEMRAFDRRLFLEAPAGARPVCRRRPTKGSE